MSKAHTTYKDRFEFDKNKPNEWVEKEIQKAAAKASLEVAKAFMQKHELQIARFPLEMMRAMNSEDITVKIVHDELIFERVVK